MAYRYNPYQQRMASNPYLEQVFQGIDLLVADADQQRKAAEAKAAGIAKIQRERREKSTERKIGLLESVVESKETFDTSTKMKAGEALFKMMQDPDLDISQIQPKPYQKPEEEKPRKRKVAKFTPSIFPQTKDKEYPVDQAEFFDREARRWIQHKKTGAGEGEDKFVFDIIWSNLKEMDKKAYSILKTGFQEGGYAGKVGLSRETVSQFINIVFDMIRKREKFLSGKGEWTKKDQELYEETKPLMVSGVKGEDSMNNLQNVILNAAGLYGQARGEE